MIAPVQTITLTSDEHFGRKVPSRAFGEILRVIPDAVRYSVRMAFEARSRATGKRPDWLAAASDIRFLDHSGEDQTVLHFESPRLGDVAKSLYAQREFWPTRPDPNDTGFDLLGDVVADIAAGNADSERFDRPLLQLLERFKSGLNKSFQRLEWTGTRYPVSKPSVITPAVIDAARRLSVETPRPEAIRIVGTLDMIRVSTNAFAIKLEGGDEARAVLTNGEVANLTDFLKRDVLVLGKAVYRSSGNLLRIDAEEVVPAADRDRFFAAIPKSSRPRYDLRAVLREQQHKRGIAAVIGKWPGDETDEEIERALKELG